MIISTNAEALKTQYPFLIKTNNKNKRRKRKTLNKLGTERNFFKLIKGIYENPRLTSYLMVKD